MQRPMGKILWTLQNGEGESDDVMGARAVGKGPDIGHSHNLFVAVYRRRA